MLFCCAVLVCTASGLRKQGAQSLLQISQPYKLTLQNTGVVMSRKRPDTMTTLPGVVAAKSSNFLLQIGHSFCSCSAHDRRRRITPYC